MTITKWKCGCGRWFEQGVHPDGMNKIHCPACHNSHWLYLDQETVDKIKVEKE